MISFCTMRRSSLFTLALFLTLVSCNRNNTAPAAAPPPSATATTASAPPPAAAPASAAIPRISYPSLAGNASAYLATPPAASGRKPAIIVIHEWWGLNDWVKQQADRFASQGYVALAVDLYRGQVASDQETAHELSRALPEDRALADLKGAFEYLAKRDDVDPARIGVIGWCMGGGYSLGLTTNEPRLAASVINYGRLVTDPATIAKIKTPILGNFGALDKGIPPADVQAFDKALHAAGKTADLKIYPDAGHAFINPNNKAGYVAADADDANARIDRFFMQTLKPGGGLAK